MQTRQSYRGNPTQKIAHCHKEVAIVAKELANANYDELMSQDILYKAWKDQNPDCVRGPTVNAKALRARFVKKNWGKYVAAARTTMALLLREPIDEAAKERIVEVLALDATLIRGRLNPSTVIGTVANKT